MVSIVPPPEHGERVGAPENEVGSETSAASARWPRSIVAVTPDRCSIISSPTTLSTSRSPRSRIAGGRERADRPRLRHETRLLVRRSESEDAAVLDPPVERVARRPARGFAGRDRVDVAIEDQRARPIAVGPARPGAAKHADEIGPARHRLELVDLAAGRLVDRPEHGLGGRLAGPSPSGTPSKCG